MAARVGIHIHRGWNNRYISTQKFAKANDASWGKLSWRALAEFPSTRLFDLRWLRLATRSTRSILPVLSRIGSQEHVKNWYNSVQILFTLAASREMNCAAKEMTPVAPNSARLKQQWRVSLLITFYTCLNKNDLNVKSVNAKFIWKSGAFT